MAVSVIYRGVPAVVSPLFLAAALISPPWFSAAIAEQPGDDLPPTEDVAAYKSCDSITPSSANLDSRIVRVVPAGPRREDGSLAFVPGVCVYLPPGYDDSNLRYPVVYLLHGGSGSQRMQFDDHLDKAYLADPANAVIQVMPDGSGLGAWFDRFDNNNTSSQNLTYREQGAAYGRTLNETYVLDWVIPYIDKHFRTIASKAGRAVYGISNGGHGAMLFAAKRPDLFTAATALSGNVAWQSFTMHELFFDPETAAYSPAYRAGNIPSNLVQNMSEVDLMFDVGTYCDPTTDDPGPAQGPIQTVWCAGHVAFEALFIEGNRHLQRALVAAQHPASNDYRETEGGHNINWWSQWVADRHLPFMLAQLADPQPVEQSMPVIPDPEAFHYRSVSYDFSIYGYEVSVDRDVREFLDLAVDGDRLTVSGSGIASVTTPARFTPGAKYIVEELGGESPSYMIDADEVGRLQISFDLGASNQIEYEGIGDSGFVQDPLVPVIGHAPAVTRSVEISAAPDSECDAPGKSAGKVPDHVREKSRSRGRWAAC